MSMHNLFGYRLAQQRRQQAGNVNPGSGSIGIRHPDDVALNSQLQTCILNLRQRLRPPNTAKAMDSKVEEYFQFCDAIFPADQYRYNLEYEKVYRFMWYQAFRDKKPRGGRRAQLREGKVFDVDAYNQLMQDFQEHQANLLGFPVPENPTGSATFDQYKAVFRLLYKEQVAAKVTSQTWDQIWQMGFDELQKHVKERAHLVKKMTYQEKVSGEFAPYTIVEHYDEIEGQLWEDGATAMGKRSCCAMLRHRYCLLHLTMGVLRCESLYRAELSDFLGLKPPKKDVDIHPMFIMINQLATGKTNHGRTLYGRATRHRNVKLCCIGALAFYLQYRFHLTNEFADFSVEDWMTNEKWFDIKLLVDVNCSDKSTAMKNDSYGKHIKNVLAKLNITCDKLLHRGRNMGAKYLDLLEEDSEEIRRMGQWNPSMFDNCYSSKLPMGPIRKLAGFHDNNKLYFNTRTTIEPPEALLYNTPMGKWCYSALEQVSSHSQNGSNATAVMVLRFLCDLNKIFLQDSAALLTIANERVNHRLFLELPVFEMEEWVTYYTVMKEALANEESPLDASLEKVLPGVHQWHAANQSAISSLERKFDNFSSEIKGTLDGLSTHVNDQHNESRKYLAATFMAVANKLLEDGPKERQLENKEPSFTGINDLVTTANDFATLTDADPPTHEEVMPTAELVPFHFKPKHTSLSDLWDEWHGTGKFADDIGVIKGRDNKHGCKWRKNLDAQHYSRTKRVVLAISNFSELNNMRTEEAIATLEDSFTACGRSVSKFVTYCQQKELLPKKKARGRRPTF